ncbi:hypothetical protein LOD99_11597 [Oopsacas minuta]|uniref:Leucine-rich repeat-containing protein 23 n=1 Tax=Oopsacas minuta TaxID=111878 RepID=A0AAV7JJY2_9METZ|nr:hypothetical protein LOD99_11597 [Oopsacas minuta]
MDDDNQQSDIDPEEERDPDQPQEDEEPPKVVNLLSPAHMKESLSLLAKINHGVQFALTRFQCIDKELTDISLLAKYKYVRYVDISGNSLTDISCLNSLPNLLRLDAERNLLIEANLGECPYLQILNLARNNIVSTSEFVYPHLRHLNLNYNQIGTVSGLDTFKLDSLRILELRGNQLTTTENISLPKLEQLYLAANQITAIEGIEMMGSLEVLHLRENPIQSLDGFSEKLCRLSVLNMRQTQVEIMNEISKLQVLSSSLKSLSFLDTPVTETENYRIETLIFLRLLDKLDKEKFTNDERLEAQELSESKLEQEQPPED